MDLRNWLFLVEDIPLTGDLWFLCSVLPWMGGVGSPWYSWQDFYCNQKHHQWQIDFQEVSYLRPFMDTGNSLTYKNTYFWWAKSCKTVDIVISHYLGCVSTIPNGTVCYLRKWILTGSVWMLQTNYRIFLGFFAFPRLLPKPPPPRRKKMKTGKWLDFLME